MRRRHFSVLLAGSAVMLALAACAPGAKLPMLASPAVNAGYKLGTGDQVRLITFGEQTLSGQFSVDDSGKIALPLLGAVPADGLTTAALADEISTALKAKNLLANPSVVVEVATYRPVFVLGEVQRPGQFPYQPHMTLLAAVAVAGGFTPRADHGAAEVVRSINGAPMDGKVLPASLVAPGDVITVFERNF